jgi:hypothetical protein
VSFYHDFGMRNPLEWLFFSFEVILTSKSKMATIRDLEKTLNSISMEPFELHTQMGCLFSLNPA